ncbi:MAG TPA: hypothetical protein PLN79_15940, partial [bacterium]|nr:hypothetical protein [bacterium]
PQQSARVQIDGNVGLQKYNEYDFAEQHSKLCRQNPLPEAESPSAFFPLDIQWQNESFECGQIGS